MTTAKLKAERAGAVAAKGTKAGGGAELARAKSSTAVSEGDSLVAEAARRGREVFTAGEALFHGYGEWLFVNLFGGDTRAVLDADAEPPEAWATLVEQCGSERLPLSRSTLYNALRVAAWDKRLADGAWNGLSFSKKVALLPLGDAKAMRAAARHVLASTLSARGAAEYVNNLRAEGAKPPRLTPQLAQRRLTKATTAFEDEAAVSKLATQLAKLDDDDKEAVKEKVERSIKQLQRLLTALGRG